MFCHWLIVRPFLRIPGDSLVNKLYDWPKRMLENGELWLAPNLPFDIQLLLTDYVVKRRFSLRKTRFAVVKISEDKRYDDNDRLVATLKDMSYNQPRELKADGGETNLLETRDNLVICSAPDFFGNFVIEITPIIWDGSIDPLTFSVEVCNSYSYMSHIITKPVYAICEQQRRRSTCTSASCSLPR